MKKFALSILILAAAFPVVDTAYSMDEKENIRHEVALQNITIVQMLERDGLFLGFKLEGRVQLAPNECAAEGLEAILISRHLQNVGEMHVSAEVFGIQSAGGSCLIPYRPVFVDLSIELPTILGFPLREILVKNVTEMGNHIHLRNLLESQSQSCDAIFDSTVCPNIVKSVECSYPNIYDMVKANNRCIAMAEFSRRTCKQGFEFEPARLFCFNLNPSILKPISE